MARHRIRLEAPREVADRHAAGHTPRHAGRYAARPPLAPRVHAHAALPRARDRREVRRHPQNDQERPDPQRGGHREDLLHQTQAVRQ